MLSRRRRPRALLLILVPLLLCGLIPTTLLLYDAMLFPLWASLIAPHPAARAESSAALLRQLSADVVDLRWSDDGTALTIVRSDWVAQNSDHGHYERTLELQSGQLSEERYVVPAEPDTSDVLAQCALLNLRITYAQAASQAQTLTLWQDQRAVASFPFTSTQTAEHTYALDPGYAAFSPDCRYAAITLSGWLYHEQDARDEVWLLDTMTRSFGPILLGRAPALALWDYPVQTVQASWSPDSTKFVFGDNQFGMEIYDLASGERRWLASPGNAGYGPMWSPSGKWIAMRQPTAERGPERLMVIAGDGQQVAYTAPCHALTAWQWSPAQDRLAYLCEEQASSQQTLWTWDAPSA